MQWKMFEFFVNFPPLDALVPDSMRGIPNRDVMTMHRELARSGKMRLESVEFDGVGGFAEDSERGGEVFVKREVRICVEMSAI